MQFLCASRGARTECSFYVPEEELAQREVELRIDEEIVGQTERKLAVVRAAQG